MEPAVFVIGSNCYQSTGMDSLSGCWHLTHTALVVRRFCKFIKLKFLLGVLRIATVNTIQRYQCRTECQQQFKRPSTHCSLKTGILIFVGRFCKSCRKFSVKVGALRKQVILLPQVLFRSKILNYFRSLTCANIVLFILIFLLYLRILDYSFCSAFIFSKVM